jgi:uncharacterized membrane protein
MFASSCKDVHKGNTASARSMVLGRRGARKETIHGVLEPIGVAASRWRMWIKLSKDGDTCIECTVSHGLTSLKNLLVCIGGRLG